MGAEHTIFTLEWANISLFGILQGSSTRGNPWGRPDRDNPIFMGAEADSLRIIERFDEVIIAPTGDKYPTPKQRVAEHFIEISRLWISRPDSVDDSAADDFAMER